MGRRNTREERQMEQRRRSEEQRTAIIAPTQNPERREAASKSVWDFGQAYFSHRFTIESCAVHGELAADLDAVVKAGGNVAVALPRGSAKTTWMEIAALYAILYGHRRFVVVVGGTGEMAEDALTRIRSEVEVNDLLMADFPEVCAPVRHLEGTPQRARSMLAKSAELTEATPIGFDWRSSRVVFPRVPYSACCGSVMVARGIDGNLRGMMHKLPTGESIRPDLVLIDDFQTRESAGSPKQCRQRINIINGDLLGMAGPRKKIAAMAAATIIRRGDAADQLTDRKLSPAWAGKRVSMVSAWSKAHDTLWMTDYAAIRRDAQRAGDAEAKEATEFYRAHREAMDEGCAVYWPARFNPDELSAIQHAYDLLIDRGEEVFYAEYQNDPKPMQALGWEITPEDVMAHLSGIRRGRVPDACETITMGCDVNPALGLNWVVTAWTGDGAGYVIDWGKYPTSDAPLWNAKSSSVTEEQAIFAAIVSVFNEIVLSRPYTRENGERARFSCAVYDAGYKREAVYKAIASLRQIAGQTLVIPIRGLSSKSYRPRITDTRGDNWHTALVGNSRALVINADIWRERAQKAFIAPVGSQGGSLGLYGTDEQAHAVYADHICAERIVDILHGDKLGTIYAWSVMPGRRNDLLDATVYACAAASYRGVTFGPIQQPKTVGPVTPAPVQQQASTKPAAAARIKPYAQRHGRGRGGFVGRW